MSPIKGSGDESFQWVFTPLSLPVQISHSADFVFLYLVSSVAVPDDQFSILRSANQKPAETVLKTSVFP